MASIDQDAAVAARTTPKEKSRPRTGAWAGAALRFFATFAVAAVAAALGWYAWRAYMATPWTRDGTVRAYVVTIAPQVAGQIVDLPVRDNAFVHKGDLLMQIDPASYAIAVRQAEAGVSQAKAVAQNAEAEWARRQKLNDLAVTLEEQQVYASKSLSANAQYQLALADLDNARLNLQRTRIVSPANGYVTNLQARVGDYANVGQRQVSVIDADSYWVDAYFEETFLESIHDGDAASVKLMGYPQVLQGYVQGVARGISVPNAASSSSGLATVNPIFTFVRLAQRVPVRIHLESVPSDVRLVAGMTATVEIGPGAARKVEGADPMSAKNPVAAVPSAAAAKMEAPPSAGVAPPLGPVETGAAAILPPLLIAGSATSGAGAPPPTVPAPRADAPAPPPPAAARSAPQESPADAARDEASEVASDEAFDRTLNITGPVEPQSHAPRTLRRRGRGWRQHERP
ncbi:efflux RND transporter periplasmic adaptor subunit [Roseiarcus sp.]|uniref:efflux RND transporter periplasmic adaptor subunit n=1 Tax=Roseiarcus sp. TaxID=1969460 RepID=UPI003F9B6ECB